MWIPDYVKPYFDLSPTATRNGMEENHLLFYVLVGCFNSVIRGRNSHGLECGATDIRFGTEIRG